MLTHCNLLYTHRTAGRHLALLRITAENDTSTALHAIVILDTKRSRLGP